MTCPRSARVVLLMAVSAAIAISAFAYQASTIPASHLIKADELAKILASSTAEKPMLVHVGFHVLYLQGHIPGSEYLGPASDAHALARPPLTLLTTLVSLH